MSRTFFQAIGKAILAYGLSITYLEYHGIQSVKLMVCRVSCPKCVTFEIHV